MPSPKKLLLEAFVELEAQSTYPPRITHGESGWSVSGTDCVLMRPDGRTSFDTTGPPSEGVFWCSVCGGHPDDPIHQPGYIP